MSADPRPALILLRHGESVLNAADRFTGLLNPPLSCRGRAEAEQAGHLIRASQVTPTQVYTSLLARTVETSQLVLTAIDAGAAPVVEPRWELDERNYGVLTGRTRTEVRQLYGEHAFHAWRRSIDGRPPALDVTDPRHSRNLFAADPRVPPQLMTATESLQQVIDRVAGFVSNTLKRSLAVHPRVLVVGHGNSLRELCVVLDALTPSQAETLHIPTGQPLLYPWDRLRNRPAVPHGHYLDPAQARSAVAVLNFNGGT